MPIKLEISSAEKHEGDAVCIAYNNNHIFSGGADGKIKVWDNSLNLVKTLDMHESYIYSIAFNKSGKLYSSSCDGCVKYINDPVNNEQIEELVRCDDSINSMYCDGDLLYTGDEKGVVTKWENDKMLFKYNIVEEVKSLAVEGTLIYTARDLDVVVSDAMPGKSGKYSTKAVFPGRAPLTLLGEMVENKRSYIAFTDRTGRGLVLAKNLTGEKFATIWELIDCHEMIINSIRGNEKFLFSAGYDGKIKCWSDIDKAKPTLVGESDAKNCINSICLGTDGAVYAACSNGVIHKAVFS
ncbi:F-box/WD repeat-containing protein lin-23 [Eupeodes corollae]|uniref:F-box/WD repeat-containing protein lin-23 n=1 Tax=Eupeodes corollae TaxID=290404 RepID=UPI0024903646|nr:F-box/WD repeat-containing protein lin-23 [Eupeodes corollae]